MMMKEWSQRLGAGDALGGSGDALADEAPAASAALCASWAGGCEGCHTAGESDAQTRETLRVAPPRTLQRKPRVTGRYGTFGRLGLYGGSNSSAYTSLQKAAALLAALWLLYNLGHRLRYGASGTSGTAGAAAPAPAPGGGPTCKEYKYPGCEAAINRYLQSGARSRCDAFERVKAEGDQLQFPSDPTRQDVCGSEGCCGCPGQCSRCPPLLKGCSSWRLDGAWKVAYEDGSEARYTFDPHGHVEVELPSTAVPPVWKPYDGAYVPAGNDLSGAGAPQWLTIPAAQELCGRLPNCRALTFDAMTKTPEDRYFIFPKSVNNFASAPGTTWRTLVNDRRPELAGGAAVAGALVEVTGGQGQSQGDSFRWDLHAAAPALFPEGCEEFMTVVDSEIKVQRTVKGAPLISGVGVELPR